MHDVLGCTYHIYLLSLLSEVCWKKTKRKKAGALQPPAQKLTKLTSFSAKLAQAGITEIKEIYVRRVWKTSGEIINCQQPGLILFVCPQWTSCRYEYCGDFILLLRVAAVVIVNTVVVTCVWTMFFQQTNMHISTEYV